MGKRLNGHLKKSEIKEIKQILLAEEERIINKQLSKKIDFQLTDKGDNKDDVDSANNNILVSTDLRFSNRERLYLGKIKGAIRRVDSDEFGICECCGGEISFSRLKARPTSEMCIHCKEESEREELNSAQGRVSKSLGQSMNLTARI